MGESGTYLKHLGNGTMPNDKAKAISYAAWLFALGYAEKAEDVVGAVANQSVREAPNLNEFSSAFRKMVEGVLFSEMLSRVQSGETCGWGTEGWRNVWRLYTSIGGRTDGAVPTFEERFSAHLLTVSFEDAFLICHCQPRLREEALWILISKAETLSDCLRLCDPAFCNEVSEAIWTILTGKMLALATSYKDHLCIAERVARRKWYSDTTALEKAVELMEAEVALEADLVLRARRLAHKIGDDRLAERALMVAMRTSWQGKPYIIFRNLLENRPGSSDTVAVRVLCSHLEDTGLKKTRAVFADAVRAYMIVAQYNTEAADALGNAIMASNPARSWAISQLNRVCRDKAERESERRAAKAMATILIKLLDYTLKPAEASDLLHNLPCWARELLDGGLRRAVEQANRVRQCVAIAQACCEDDSLRVTALHRALELAQNRRDLSLVLDEIDVAGNDDEELAEAARCRVDEIALTG